MVRYRTLALALLLCAVAVLTITLDAPWRVTLVCVGAFVLFTPGLVVIHVLALPDRLLALVLAMVTGPSLWVVVATLQLFTGLWAPRTTVLSAAVLFALLALLLIGTDARRTSEGASSLDTPAHDAKVEHHTVEDVG